MASGRQRPAGFGHERSRHDRRTVGGQVRPVPCTEADSLVRTQAPYTADQERCPAPPSPPCTARSRVSPPAVPRAPGSGHPDAQGSASLCGFKAAGTGTSRGAAQKPTLSSACWTRAPPFRCSCTRSAPYGWPPAGQRRALQKAQRSQQPRGWTVVPNVPQVLAFWNLFPDNNIVGPSIQPLTPRHRRPQPGFRQRMTASQRGRGRPPAPLAHGCHAEPGGATCRRPKSQTTRGVGLGVNSPRIVQRDH